MAALITALRSGAWLTRERMRLIAIAMLFTSAAGFAWLLATGTGLNDYQNRPIGTDFSNVYAAGTYVLDGRPEAPFDPPQQHGREQVIFGAETPFYGWHYPPIFLFVAAALALMPYLAALTVWQAATLGLYLVAIRAIIFARWPGFPRKRKRDDRRADNFWLLPALAFPAVFINIGHGHNGFLTAALTGAALLLLDRRPVVAGILFGLLAYKPQFGLLIPLVLATTGRWRTFAAAAATVGALAFAATLAFGPQVWDAFFASTRFTRIVVLENGGTGWHKIQSIFSWVRMWGGSVPLAYAVQGAATLAFAGSLIWLWRSAASFALKAAALTIAMLLATPYSLDYDMTLLSVAIAFLAADGRARGFLPWEKTALAALWFVPLIARAVAERAMLPLGVTVMLMVFVLILRRAMSDQSVRQPVWLAALLLCKRSV